MRPWEYWSVPAAVVMGCCGAAVGTLDAGLGERGRVPLSASGVPRAVTTLSESCRTAFSEARQAGRGSRYRCIDPPTRTLPSLDNLGCRESCPAYQQIYEQVRAKDDVSFKLLSLVPLISGAGISILVKTDLAWGLKCFVSLFGATVTFSIFRWELRNIQWCDWLLKQAKNIDHVGAPPQPKLRISRCKRVAVGKTEAETILYLAVILAWLVLPGLDAFARPKEEPGVVAAVAALVVGVALGTWAVMSSRVDWKRLFEPEAAGLTRLRTEQRPVVPPVDKAAE